MYKTRLQEICHQRMWAPPDYTVTRDGADHDPRFRASVTVNSVSFHAPDLSKSSKEAQNKAAQAAFNHLAATLPPKSSPQPPVVENQINPISYKSQLQTYAQRNNIDLPKYDVVREGYAHAPRFKGSVTVNGQTFYSLQFFSTSKEAENDSARVALSFLSLNGSIQDESTSYKNLLQQFVQKQSISLPKYSTVSIGACHMPIFSSTIEIGGDSFVGDVANTKKQAEMNAAKVAWCKLKERSDLTSGIASLSLLCPANQHLEPASSESQSKDSTKLESQNPLSLSLSHVNIKCSGDSSAKKQEGGVVDKNGCSTVMASILSDYQVAPLTNVTNADGKEHAKKMSASHNKLVPEVRKEKEHTPEVTFFQDGTSTLSLQSGCSSTANVISESPLARTGSLLPCNRVSVYPRKPDMVLPEGATILPFSDDMWVAVSLDFSNHEVLDANSGRTSLSSSSSVFDQLKPASSGTHLKSIQTSELPNSLSVVTMKHTEEYSDKVQEDERIIKNDLDPDATATILHDCRDAHLPEETMVDGTEQKATQMSACQNTLNAEVPKNKEDVAEDTLSQDGNLVPSSPLDLPDDLFADFISDSPMQVTSPALLCNRVRVYPRKPDMVLPEGATLLPFSNDMWVAVSLDFSNHESQC